MINTYPLGLSQDTMFSMTERELNLEAFRRWGKLGGKARAKALTPERRREIATKAGKTPKKRKNGGGLSGEFVDYNGYAGLGNPAVVSIETPDHGAGFVRYAHYRYASLPSHPKGACLVMWGFFMSSRQDRGVSTVSPVDNSNHGGSPESE